MATHLAFDASTVIGLVLVTAGVLAALGRRAPARAPSRSSERPKR
jgi:hypothetical protein